MSANFTGAALRDTLIGWLEYRENFAFFLMSCLVKFAVQFTGASVVSVFSGMLMLSQAQHERLMEFGVTFVQSDYSRGYEPVYMNDFHFYNDIYLINVEDVEKFDGFVKQLHAAQLILNPDRQTFIFLWSIDDPAVKNETAGPGFERFFRSASEYIYEFIVIRADRFLPHATHHLPGHQRLIHMLEENYFAYYYWNSCLEHPSKITASAVNFQSKEHLREYFSDGRLCPPKVDRMRVRLSAWAPFVDVDSPPGSLNFTSGLDIQLITTIARQLNVSLEYSDSPDGWSDNFLNDSTVNNWKALQVQDVDMVLSSTITTKVRYKYFHATVSYFHDSDGFCVPVALRRPQYKRWFEMADIFVALFAMYIIIVPVMYYYGRKYNPELPLSKVYVNCMASLCSLSIPRVPHGERARWLYMCWLLYCFFINIYFQSKLISIMYKPGYEKQVATQEDLINSNYRILFLPHYMRYFEGPYDPHEDRIQYLIQQRIEPCINSDVCLRNVSFDRTAAMCIQKTYLEYRMNNYLDPEGASLIYCFKEPINLSPILFHVNRNFPLLKKLDRQIMNVKESGIIPKWAENIFRNVVRGLHSRAASDTEYKPLELGMVRLLFYMWLVGIGISIVGFLGELVYYRQRVK